MLFYELHYKECFIIFFRWSLSLPKRRQPLRQKPHYEVETLFLCRGRFDKRNDLKMKENFLYNVLYFERGKFTHITIFVLFVGVGRVLYPPSAGGYKTRPTSIRFAITN